MEPSPADKEEVEAEEPLRSEEEEEDEEEGEEGWDDWCSDGEDVGGGLLCLFCSSRFDAENSLFEHCAAEHCFDFHRIVKELGLDFYSCIKLINFARSKVRQQHPSADSNLFWATLMPAIVLSAQLLCLRQWFYGGMKS
jgi:protein arginine N-methyltransferase 3